jgi:hypothetical protein
MITSRRIKWTLHVAHMGEKRIAYKVLVGNQEAQRTLGRWKMDFRERR